MYATIDIETTGLNRFKDKITYIGIGLAHNIGEKFFKGYILNMSVESNLAKLHEIIEYLKREKAKTIFQNGKFDTLFMHTKYGVMLPISEDVMLMGTAYDLADEHGLKYMAKRYLGVDDWDISKKDKTSGTNKIVPYLKKDLKYTWELFCFFMQEMNEVQMKIYRKLLRPAYLMYRKAEKKGIYFDKKEYKNVKAKYKKIEEEKLDTLKRYYDINWNSPQQKVDVLFLSDDGEKLPIIKKTNKGKPSADAEVLKKLAAQGHTLPQLMLDYTAANTLNKMFLSRWGDDSCYDGRIHPNFNLTNVVSGRTSCSEPNLQQVPRQKDVRALFHAPKKKLFFEADYSQLELRIAAHYALEKTMLEIYKNSGDIHTSTAKLVLPEGVEPSKEDRNKAKAVNFGFLYGMGWKGFVDYAYNSYGVVFTQEEAKVFRDAFFRKYSGLLPWHAKQIQLCEAQGGVSNLFGRFRKLPDIYSHDWGKKGGAQRRAINTPVQGTGSDILLSSAVEIDKKLGKEGVSIVGSVHDSILGEFYEEDKDWVVDEIRKIMVHPHLLDVFEIELKCPLEVDVGVGKWGTH